MGPIKKNESYYFFWPKKQAGVELKQKKIKFWAKKLTNFQKEKKIENKVQKLTNFTEKKDFLGQKLLKKFSIKAKNLSIFKKKKNILGGKKLGLSLRRKRKIFWVKNWGEK